MSKRKNILGFKYKADGLGVILIFLVIKIIVVLQFVYELQGNVRYFEIFSTVLHVFVALIISFFLVRAAQSGKLPDDLNEYFLKFNLFKGLAVTFLYEAVLFWYNVISNYHYAIRNDSDFLTIEAIHLLYFVIAVLGSIFYLISNIIPSKREKISKNKIHWTTDILPNLFMIRFFFRENGENLTGKTISCIAGGAYLFSFYMLLISFFIPSYLMFQTEIEVTKSEDNIFLYRSKFQSVTKNYCLLEGYDKNGRELKFAVNKCESCDEYKGTTINVLHDPINYLNWRRNVVYCK